MTNRTRAHQAYLNVQNALMNQPFQVGDDIIVLPAYSAGCTLTSDSVTGPARVARVFADDIELECGAQVSKARCLPLNRPL